jgi:hypothetical protein
MSQDYFSLMKSGEDVQQALALGKNIILIVDGKAYQLSTMAPHPPQLRGLSQPPLMPILWTQRLPTQN